jgi:hypothetical protein
MKKRLFRLDDNDFWNQVNEVHQEKGGVYRLLSIQEGKPKEINRFLGVDREGILYIGKAESFLDRVSNLKKSIAPGYRGTAHGCGINYKSNPAIEKLYPYESLYLELLESESPRKLEAALIKEYVQTYGEVPPLNAVC